MLRDFRKASQSWAARIMLLLLIASFGLWGISDIFRSGREPSVAQVGETSIGVSAFNSAFEQAVERLRQISGQPVSAEEARSLGLDDQALYQLIGDSLMDQEAHRLGIRTPDEVIKERIAETPYFLNEQGAFDTARYRAVLTQLGMSPEQYEDSLRRDGAREQLFAAVRTPPPAPDSWADTLYRYRNDQRVADFVLVAKERDYPIPEPGEEDLRAFYDENPDRFTAPEFRRATFVRFGADMLEAEIEPSDEDLYEEYEARLAEFQEPERRQVEQLLVPDEATAEAARELLKSGKSLEEVAAALGEKGAGISPLGLVGERDLPPEIAPTVFALSKGGVSNPVKTGFGWHFFWVREIEPAQTQSFEEVREQLGADYTASMALDSLYRLATAFEDSLAGGAMLEAASESLNLPLDTLGPVDAAGFSPEGKAVELPAEEGFVGTLFSADPGADSGLIETQDGRYYILRVDEVTPSGVEPFEEVRGDVATAWRDAKKDGAAKALAQSIAEKVNGGENLAALAEEHGLSLETSAPLKRRAQPGAPHALGPLREQLFALEPGETAAVMTAFDSGFLVATLKSVEPADPSRDPDGLKALRKELEGTLAGDAIIAFQGALQQRFPVTINLDVLQQLAAPSDGDGG